MSRRGKLAKGKAEAKRPLARTSAKDDGAKVRDLEKRLAEALKLKVEALERERETGQALTEALEQQTATSEVLSVISRSPGDLGPVFEAMLANAVRLCEASFGNLLLYDGDAFRHVALHNAPPGWAAEQGRDPVPPRDLARVLYQVPETKQIVHVADIAAENPDEPIATIAGARTLLIVPMLKENKLIGVIAVYRQEVRPFGEKQIELVKTFADQAVIAIENARLFTETKEALDRQTATSEILRVISSSPTDVQPVFDAIARNAVTLCGGITALVLRFDGEMLRLVGHHAMSPEGVEPNQRAFPRRPGRDSPIGRAFLDRSVVHVPDLQAATEFVASTARQRGAGSLLVVPLLREQEAIGVIGVTRDLVGPFSSQQITLLQTFADQAVVAIENVRLFTELDARNRDLTQALEQQTATSEILRVISNSPTAVEPVFEAIVTSGRRLCEAHQCLLVGFDGEMLTWLASDNFSPAREEALRSIFPYRPTRGGTTGRVVLDRAVVHIPDVLDDPDHAHKDVSIRAGARAQLAVPMFRENEVIGALHVARPEPGPFSEAQIALLQTFADQAVIAIENVRLFAELQARNRDLTATSEILRVISSSPTDAQPVFEAIVESAVRVSDGTRGNIYIYDGELIHHVAEYNGTTESQEFSRAIYPRRPGRDLGVGRAVLDRAVVHIPDTDLDRELSPELVRARGFRSAVAIPLLRDGSPLGVIGVTRPGPGPFQEHQIELLETFAAQAVIAIENVRLFTELQQKNEALTQAHAQVSEALEQQTATSQILGVISRSPTAVQPVFDTIVASASQLCDAVYSVLATFDGELVDVVAAHNWTPAAWEAARRILPAPPSRALASGRAILERAVVHVPDVDLDPEYSNLELRRTVGFRSLLVVPMIREGEPLGTILVGRANPGAFSDSQIALLRTFADQAVIAIENVRLFNETKEALEQQTATAEILKVISSSPTDVQPVFDAIVRTGTRLSEASLGFALRYDGQLMTLVANHNATNQEIDAAVQAYPRPATPDSLGGRVLLERAVVQIADVSKDPTYRLQAVKEVGFRTGLGVPLLRGGTPIGAFGMWRREVRPFGERQIELLKTFADQAVIAIENVRLFTELQASNRELTAALDTQTATSEILRVISRSSTDEQPVFDAIVRSAQRLLRTNSAALRRLVGEELDAVAYTTTTFEGDPIAPPRTSHSIHGFAGSAARNREPMVVTDMLTDARVSPEDRDTAGRRGYRSMLSVPLLREHDVLGIINVTRRQAGGFTDDEITLLQTFADQAVIAIENARLLSELQTRTEELTRSVGELTALGEVSRALSSTLDLETVLQTIVVRANELAGTAGCNIWEYDETREQFHLRASHYADERDGALLRSAGRVTTIPRGQGVTTRVMEGREPVQIHDITTARDYESPIRRPLIEAGHRALLGVPLVSEDEVIGVLAVTRKRPGEFEPETVGLLSTFATQSALAIQNARLFLEIEDKSRQLEVASQHKSEFLANMSHELRTPLNAIIGFAEVLTERMFGELNEKQDEYLKDIYVSGQHLLSLINDILDLSKIEAGRMELEPTDFDLPSAIDNAVTLVRERAGRRGMTLGREIDDRVGMMRGDERKVKQVLLNLLSNAIKFTPEGGRIDVRAAVIDEVVEVSVADTGVGIAPEDHEKVFEEFRQVGTADKKVEGTGLGLALSRKFIELHGGRIWMKSELGHGSTFTFTLPVRQDDGSVPLH